MGDCPVLVATVEGLLQRTMPPAVFAASCRQLHVGQVCQPEGLTDFLVRAGYTRCDQVEGTGQFALRGGILDVFSPGLDLPVRMEFWGDEIDSMGLFDPVTQRRTAQRETCTLLPAGEVLLPQDDPWTGPPDLALGRVYDQLTTPADYLPGNALVGLCDTPRVAERAKNYLWQLGQDITALLEQGLLTGKPPVLAPAFEALCVGLAPRTLLYLDAFPTGAPPVPPAALLSFTARQLSGYGIRFASVTEDLLQYQKEDFAVVLLASSRRKADALQAMLHADSGSRPDAFHCAGQLVELAVNYGFEGNLWHCFLAFCLANNENAYTTSCEITGAAGGSLDRLAREDFKIFKALFDYDIHDLAPAGVWDQLASYESGQKGSRVFNKRIRDRIVSLAVNLKESADVEEFQDHVEEFYREFGVGKFGLNKAFRIVEKDGGQVVLKLH